MNVPSAPVTSLLHRAQNVGSLLSSGVVAPSRPDRLARALLTWRRFGPTPATAYGVAAARHPDQLALVDEIGALTYREVNERTDDLARALVDRGVGPGDGVGIMCRNHRGWVDTVVACSKIGANALLLNTSFSGPQLSDVCDREDPRALVFDGEFSELVQEAARDRLMLVAWHEDDDHAGDENLRSLIEEGGHSDLPSFDAPGKVTILTSGTTGTPKGASRSQPKSLEPVGGLLAKIPLRARGTTVIAPPLFHAWGFLHWTIGSALGCTLVTRRRFDPEQTLLLTAQHRASTLVVVPVMLQRILELDPGTLERYDLRALRVIAASGSALTGPLATKVLDTFGDKLYNLYGSTEVSWAAIAQPQDLREAPGCAGRVPRGTTVRLYGDDDREVAPGETGRIFVGSDLLFEGYTGGGSKDVIDGFMATGDVGHFDEGDRLYVDGRDDDMIVSGGENVFPGEVEDLLSGHDGISDAAVLGVDDEEFGQRLKAVVVRRKGKKLSEKQVKDFVKANLASFKVPRDVEFVDELPRTSTGKVLKRELAGGGGEGKGA